MPDPTLRILLLGAHPDDAEYHAGGVAAIYRSLGHVVKMISVTDGSAGHQNKPAEQLAEIRRGEAANSGAVIGATYDVWDFPDAFLEPTLEVRHRIVGEIRAFAPDLVLTHRPNDYHPDHRAVGRAVQDASFLVTVPRVVPDVPTLKADPVVAYMPDLFTRPAPLRADVVVDTTDHVDTIVAMLAQHRSQVFDWLPHLMGIADQVPKSEEERFQWLRGWYVSQVKARADRYRQELIDTYGDARGAQIETAEMFEISEYASAMDEAARHRLFPFLETVE